MRILEVHESYNDDNYILKQIQIYKCKYLKDAMKTVQVILIARKKMMHKPVNLTFKTYIV